MFYGFVGNDTQKSKREASELVSRLTSSGISTNVIRFDDQNFNIDVVRETLLEQNLFGGPNVIVLNDILAHPHGEEFYKDTDLNTDNIIVSRETAPKKPIMARFNELGEIKEFKEEKTKDKFFGDFALADSIFIRDKKAAWVEFEKSRRRGDAMEAIHGMVFWALKTMLAVETLPRSEAIASGVKDFTYRKVQSGLSKYKTEEILKKIDRLKDIYHEAHRGDGDFEIELEKFILGL